MVNAWAWALELTVTRHPGGPRVSAGQLTNTKEELAGGTSEGPQPHPQPLFLSQIHA